MQNIDIRHREVDAYTLLDQRLLERIASHQIAMPGNELLGNIYRRQGDLVSASVEYERLKNNNISGSGRVDFFNAVFNQKKIPARGSAADFAPAPFVQFGDFLDQASNLSLLDGAIAKENTFNRAGSYNTDIAHVNHRVNLMNVEVGQPGESLRAAVLNKLALICDGLGLPVIGIKSWELKITAYLDGHFFKAHQDKEGRHADRQISFVYFFHQEPKPYEGGELLLHDSRFSPRAYHRSLFTRIIPRNNSVVFFPSEYFHQVLPVQTQDRDFRSSRFTMTGHIS
jgi:SM-20-related protein